MEFAFTPEHEEFRSVIRKFAEKEVLPKTQELDERDEFPLPLFRKLGEMGMLAFRWGPEFGGVNADTLTNCIFIEELARANTGFAAGVMAHMGLGLAPVNALGTAEQKEAYLKPGARGEKIGALGLTEPGAGSDVPALKTRARKDGEFYVIDGTKMFITNGSIADFVIVAAYTDGAGGQRGLSLFLVDRGTKGFTVGRKLAKLGWRASDTAELVFEGCRVHRSRLLGPEGEGYRNVLKTLQGGRVGISAFAVAVAQAALDAAVRFSRDRHAFGQPIHRHQAVRFKLARMATLVDAARLLVYRSAWMYDQKGMDGRKEASMAKLFAAEVVQEVTRDAVHLHGGYGFMMEYDVQRYYRDAMIYSIGEGTSEIQLELISRAMGL